MLKHISILVVTVLVMEVFRAGAQSHSYDEEMNFIDALGRCQEIGDGWFLPQMVENNDVLLKHLHQLRSAWLGIRKHIYEEWRWLNGQNYTFTNKISKTELCGALTRKGEIVPTSCDKQIANHICEFQENVECPRSHMCFKANTSVLAVGCHSGSWFTARSFCERMGGRLIIFKSDNKLNITTSSLSTFNCKNSDNLFYIGLHKEDWIPVTDVADQRQLSFSETCAVAVLNQRGRLEKMERYCLNTSPVICVQNKILSTTTIQMDVITPHKADYGSSVLIGAAVGIPSLLLLIITITITLMVIRHRFRNSPRHREQKKRQDVDTGETGTPLVEIEESGEGTKGDSSPQTTSVSPRYSVNILITGQIGAGKSSLVNRLIVAMGAKTHRNLAQRGVHVIRGKIQSKTRVLNAYTLRQHPEIIALREERLNKLGDAQIVLFDMPGMENKNDGSTKRIYKMIINGNIPRGTTITKIKECGVRSCANWMKYVIFKRGACRKGMDGIIFVHPATDDSQALDESTPALAEALAASVEELDIDIPVFLVITKIDNGDIVEEKLNSLIYALNISPGNVVRVENKEHDEDDKENDGHEKLCKELIQLNPRSHTLCSY